MTAIKKSRSVKRKPASRNRTATTKKRPKAKRPKLSLFGSQRGAVKRSIISPKHFSKKTTTIFVLVFATVGTYVLLKALAATTLLATLEAKDMVLPPNTTSAIIIQDSSVNNERVMHFKGNTVATGSASLIGKAASNQLTVRAKGVACQGDAQMEIKVNGAQAKIFTVGSSWANYTYNPTIAANTIAEISVAFINDNNYTHRNERKNCSRDLYVHKVSLYEVIPDTIAANITTPSTAASTINGPLAVEAKPVSSNGISKVEFFVGGTPANGYRDGTLTTEASPPYCLAGDGGTATTCSSWNSSTAPVANGTYPITAYAYDSANIRSAPQTVTITVANTTTSPPPPLTGWELLYEDNFDGTDLNTSYTDTTDPDPSKRKSAWAPYTSDGHSGNGLRRPSAFSVSGGVLTVTAQMQVVDGVNQLVSGGMSNKTPTTYGRFEARVRTEVDPNVHPTDSTRSTVSGLVLTYPAGGDNMKNGELDFYETLRPLPLNATKEFYGFLHWPFTPDRTVIDSHQTRVVHQADRTQWHDMAMEWTHDTIKIYRDGALVHTLTERVPELLGDGDRIPDVAHKLCIQLDAFGEPAPTASFKPVHMYVDYIRVYKKV